MREKMGIVSVAVIMSTYNGDKYLQEQIDSILMQEQIKTFLFIRDDGSKDDTQIIIKEYSERFENVFFVNEGKTVNLGVRDSFLSLLRQVYEEHSDIPYFAFADQDDVWKSEKLFAAVQKVEEEKCCKKPLLYYSNKTIVDEDLNILYDEHIKYYGDILEILWNSLASGCTMLMNRDMVRLAIYPEVYSSLFLHDSWVYKLAKISGAIILFDPQSYILYRQHGNNFCGPVKIITLKSLLSAFSMKRHLFSPQIKELVNLHGSDISEKNRQFIEWVMNYDNHIGALLHLMFTPMALRRGLLLYLDWVAKLLLHRI